MRLGASSIIPVDVPDAAVKRMTDALHGTRFSRPYDRDLRQVEEETTGLLRGATFNRSSFCEAVERLLAAADGFDVESCLVGLEGDDVEPWRVLVTARRQAREFVAFAENRRAWFYWYGCRADAVAGILKRMNVELRWEVHGEAPGILCALDRLRQA